MAALDSSIPQWVPEDDILLKNAIEGGASLEALAKGAVRFSRKFTLGELRDRWHSLLYDPVISAQASTKMVEFELSLSNTKAPVAELSAKRKLESVQRLYHLMRKKTTRSQSGSFLGASDTSCRDYNAFNCNQTLFEFVEKERYNELPVEVPSFEHDNMEAIVSHNVRDRLVDFQSCERIKEIGLPHSLPEGSPSFHADGLSSSLAMWETIEAVPINVSMDDKGPEESLMQCNELEFDGTKAILSGMNVVHPEAILHDKHNDDVLNNSTAISECDYADLSESLLNFANEDGPLLADADGEEAVDKSCYDGILVTSSNDVHGISVDVKSSLTLVSDKSFEIPSSKCVAKIMAEGPLSAEVEKYGHFNPEINLPSSTSAVNIDYCNGEIACTLNSEDTEIPCNDDIFLNKEFTSSTIATTSRQTGYLSLSCAYLNDNKNEQSLVKREENPAQFLIASQMQGLEILSVTNLGPLVGCRVKCQSPEDTALIQASNAHREPNQCRTAEATLTSGRIGLPKPELLHACNAMGFPLYAQVCSPKQITSEPEADHSLLNDEESESEDDVPSYSEVEAMILQMDLCPDDTYSYNDREVARYHNEDTRRTIIRLEQCAQSSMQRAIASRGALAVLYGRHLKHYIRETEVILGRATKDTEVDIDLGREGPANKISRRQALIKLEANGSFLLRNLGRSSVFLNGREVVAGQNMGLGSSSLIEIGEMAFMFEVNSKSVGRHLSNAFKNCQRNVKFEWSEGVP